MTRRPVPPTPIDHTDEHIMGTVRDIKFALDHAAIVATTDAKGRITYANDLFCEISQYTRNELLGENHRIINSSYHPVSFFSEMWAEINSGNIWRGEIRNMTKKGSYYWVDTTIVPFVDCHGIPYQHMAIRHEITERKRTASLLREKETLARLGELAAVVAHEVRNPLGGISGAIQILRERSPEGSRDRAIMRDILHRVEALDTLVIDLLIFAKPKPPVFIATKIHSLLVSIATTFQQDSTFSNISVRVEGDKPTASIDPHQFSMAIRNLMLNAAQAMMGTGKIKLVVRITKEGDVSITIRDSGPGLTSEVMKSVFEPFYTTKHRGSGLGLSVTRQIVEAHGGTISAGNASDGGAIFVVNLRRSPEDEASG